MQDLNDSVGVQGKTQCAERDPTEGTTFVEDMQVGIERDRIDLLGLDPENVHVLMAAPALVREDVLQHAKEPDCSQPDTYLFAEFATKCCLGSFAELNAAADGAIELLAGVGVRPALRENVPIANRQAHRNTAD